MFRCPKCAQAHRIDVPDDAVGNVTVTHDTEMTMTYIDGHEHSHEAAQVSFSLMSIDPMIKCEKENCGEENLLSKWIEAWNEPLNFFEMPHEQLCHCGGELWMDRIPGTYEGSVGMTGFGLVCDRCEWVKPARKAGTA